MLKLNHGSHKYNIMFRAFSKEMHCYYIIDILYCQEWHNKAIITVRHVAKMISIQKQCRYLFLYYGKCIFRA
jgi:hypothetical protein